MGACSTQLVRVDYDKNYAQGVKLKTTAWDSAKNMGEVRARVGGPIWADCRDLAEQAIEEVTIQAKDMGANAVGDLNYAFSNNSTPACKKRWGYILLLPVILTPLSTGVELNGIAYQTAGSKKTRAYSLPLSSEDKEAIISTVFN